MVFQAYALFPHMTVEQNVAYGLKLAKVEKNERRDRVAAMLETVGLHGFEKRRPAQLSGGQQQRVALARALVNRPAALLLDEPLGALDVKLRLQMRLELKRIQNELGTTFVFVTHDQDEALSMSDRIAVMNHGVIMQMGDAEALYEHPRTRYVSTFLGSCNLLDATRGEAGVVNTSVGALRVVAMPDRDKFTLGIRPEKISLCAPGECAGENRIPVKVKELIYIGSETHYVLQAGNQTLTAEAMNVKVGSQGFDLGADAVAYLPPAGLLILDD
jgi:spermidine/putrescine transport system ATP-binding protein